MAKQVDLIIVGGGPGGYVAAIRAAQLGAKVALLHNNDLGGTCLNRGCIPSKALIHCAAQIQNAKAARAVGLTFGEPEIDFDKIRAHARRTIDQMATGILGLLKSNKIASSGGRGRLTGPNQVTVEADGEVKGVLEAPHIIWATGSLPARPPIPCDNSDNVITSDDGVTLPGPPQELAIVGGGTLGCEFAYIYSQMGTQVHLLEMCDRIMPTEEPEISQILASELSKLGVRIYTSCKCSCISDCKGGKRVEYECAEDAEAIDVDMVMLAAGRCPNIDDMGLEEVGIETDKFGIVVDETLQTSVASVYAIGDCIRGIGLAHQASCEGTCAAEITLGVRDRRRDLAIPAAMYTHPEIASVGLREYEAEEAGRRVRVGTFHFSALGKAAATRSRIGFVKVIVDARSDRVIGASIIGDSAADLISLLAVAVQNRMSALDVAETCHAHPTLFEAVGEAALDTLDRAIHIPPK